MPGVTALTLAGCATLSDGTTFATFVMEPTNKSAVDWIAKRRKPHLLGRYCKAVLACKELEEGIQRTTGSTEASPQAHSTALVPVVPAWNPPQPPASQHAYIAFSPQALAVPRSSCHLCCRGADGPRPLTGVHTGFGSYGSPLSGFRGWPKLAKD